MHNALKRCLTLALLGAMLASGAACSSYQSTKNVWKGTKGLWYDYVSSPASIDYEDKGTLSAEGQALVDGMMGVDIELDRLERLMSNADRPPTRGWLNGFFSEVPWVDGFTGVRADGTLLGTETPPGKTGYTLDYNRLLYEPDKQSSRALRGDWQMSAQGPVVLLAAPLYDGIEFLGIVTTYFRMSSLVNRLKTPENVVIFTPWGLLWSPFEYGATPMAGIDWNNSVTKVTYGTVSNATGSFVYQVRFLGSLPIIFAVAQKGDFPRSSGSLADSGQYFPQREPVGPPPPKETEEARPSPLSGAEFLPPKPGEEARNQSGPTAGARDLEAGSADSMLLQQGGAQPRSRVRERDLEGENTDYQPPRRQRQQRPQQQQRRLPPIVIPDMPEEDDTPPPQIVRPSPFGPRAAQPATSEVETDAAPAETGSEATGAESPALAGDTPDTQASETPSSAPVQPALLPGGRPSPFGPRPAPAPEASEMTPAESEPEPESRPEAATTTATQDASPVAHQRPSPFGPRPAPAPEASEMTPAESEPEPESRPEAATTTATQDASPVAHQRPSPFGPRTAPTSREATDASEASDASDATEASD